MDSLSKKEISVEIITDYICPWCYIGKRRLEMAIDELSDSHIVEIKFVPFELNPNQPVNGLNRRAYREKKFGSWHRSLMMDIEVTRVGKDVGLDFNYEKVELTPNTFKAHLLTAFAAKWGKHQQISKAIFSAYFTEGKDIGSENVLFTIAEENGLDPDMAKKDLQSEVFIKDVKSEEKLYQAMGVSSVPLFVIGNKAISGAQSVETFKEFIRSSDKS